MSNTWVNPTVVAKETLRQLKNNCVMANLVHRGYEGEWQKQHDGWKPGSSIRIKAPIYARVKDGATLDVHDINERYLTLTLSYRKHVAVEVTSDEMTYNSEKGIPRVAEAAAQALGEYIDQTLLGLYKTVPNQVGTPGITPKDFLSLALCNARMSDYSVPVDNRRLVVNPTAQAYIANELKNLYNPAMVGPAVEKMKFATLAGMDCFVSQNVNMHTCGTAAGVAALAIDATAPVEGATSLTIDNGSGDWTTTLKQGDIFTSAASYGVNPVTGANTGHLRQFCIDADVTDAGTEATVTCTPGTDPHKIYSASATEKFLPYQTVTVLPAENDVVSVAGTASLVHPVNLGFHRDAFALCMVPLAVPDSVSWKGTASYEGFSIRVIKDYDVTNDKEVIRFDVLFAADAINRMLACRLAG
ncbi:MAG: P22 phage major capsid protein family protein [Methanoregula sp.]